MKPEGSVFSNGLCTAGKRLYVRVEESFTVGQKPLPDFLTCLGSGYDPDITTRQKKKKLKFASTSSVHAHMIVEWVYNLES